MREGNDLIRPWTEAGQRSVAEFLATLAASDPGISLQLAVHGPDQDPPLPFRRTLVAVDRNDIIGLGTLWENSLHPTRWRVTLHVRPAFWSRGPASALLAQLRALQPERRGLQTAMSALDEAGCEFFQQHGFTPLMRTRRGVLAPYAIPAEFDLALARIEATGYRVASLAELRSAPPANVLAWLHAELYRLGHQWDPVRPVETEEAIELFLDPAELLPEAMYLAFRGAQPVAVASLRRSGTPAQVDLGWAGALPEVATSAGDLVLALVGRSLHHATRENWDVLLEVDEADTRLWQLLEQLPLTLEPEWLTFAEPPCQSA